MVQFMSIICAVPPQISFKILTWTIFNSWLNKTWYIEQIVRNESCGLCRALCWMYKSTPRHQIFADGVASGTVVWYGSNRSQFGLSLEFSHGIKGYGLTGYPYDCSYALHLTSSGHLGRRIHNLTFDHHLVREEWLHSCDSSHNCLFGGESRVYPSHTQLRMIDVRNYCVVAAPRACGYAALRGGKLTSPYC